MKENVISFRERHSIVWIENGRIYKRQPKHNTDNEYYYLRTLEKTGYVPQDVRMEDIETVSMEYIPSQKVTNPDEFKNHLLPILDALSKHGIRHGDLTDLSVLIKDNRPIVIDFGESRWKPDPIQDKRDFANDAHYLYEALAKKCRE